MADTCNRLREVRENHGLNQGQLAHAVGVSRQTINAIETGRFDPSLPLALKLSALFSVSVESLFSLKIDLNLSKAKNY
ncbi:MAG: helix-turn-helix transcriptional regulator [Propionibacteriaceae bacterium]